MCDDTMTCDYMTIVSRVTVIFTLGWQLVCRSQQRNEFNINIVTVTPDSESRAQWASLLLLSKLNNPEVSGW